MSRRGAERNLAHQPLAAALDIDAEALSRALLELAGDDARRGQRAEAASEYLASRQGATERYLDMLRPILEPAARLGT